MDLATRIAQNPDAYLNRFNRIETARKSAAENKVIGGKLVMHRIFMGPVGEFWMTTSAAVAKSLTVGGYEMIEYV